MPAIKLQDVVDATGARLVRGSGDTVINSVVLDSRQAGPGSLFVALSGARVDGHQFLAAAHAKGAVAALVQEHLVPTLQAPTAMALIAVADTLQALHHVATWHRGKFAGPVVAVTGSNGKTTTKDMIAAVLATKYNVLATPGNLNSEYGLPITLLQRQPAHDAIVVEMGMRGLGQIATLARIARPTIGVVTNIGPVHMELLGSMDNIAAAKGELYAHLRKDDTAVVNADEPRVMAAARDVAARKITYGLTDGAMVTASHIETKGFGGTAFTLTVAGQQARVRLPIPGRHNVSNALAAAAVGWALGLDADHIATGLGTVQLSGMRMQLEKVGQDVTVLNDAYNASPASMLAALRTLAELPGVRRLAVLGDMYELGHMSDQAHRSVGEACARGGVAELIAVGERARHLAAGALDAGLPQSAVHWTANAAEAAALVHTRVRPGDTVLVKASRGVGLEVVVRSLREACSQ